MVLVDGVAHRRQILAQHGFLGPFHVLEIARHRQRQQRGDDASTTSSSIRVKPRLIMALGMSQLPVGHAIQPHGVGQRIHVVDILARTGRIRRAGIAALAQFRPPTAWHRDSSGRAGKRRRK